MMNAIRKPTILTGALVGACFTAALIAVFYLIGQLVGTPFVPFDIFDWVGRVLPGPLITFGIDTIVNIITTLKLGETSSAAKAAEQFMAIGGMFATGVVAGAVLFAIVRRSEMKSGRTVGIVIGLVIGVPVMLISASVNLNATTPPIVNAIWILLAFAVWGWLLAWAYDRLVELGVSEASTGNAVEAIDRRQFLVRMGSATAAITVVGAGVGALLSQAETPSQATALNTGDTTEMAKPWSASNTLPNADDTLVPAAGTRSELTPLAQHYRIDINTIPPEIREEEWKLSIGGLVDAPLEMTLDDIKAYEPMHQFVTLACISNRIAGDLIGTTRWTGVSLKKLVPDFKLKPNATHLKITAADNFDEFVALDTINNDDRVMLAYAWDGLPLEVKHGFPLRIYIPNHYGMKQPKWITNIEAVEGWQEGWWVRRGWDKDAIMRATSVIDTVAVDDAVVGDGSQKLIPVGGIAHAGDRGISKVEVKVDDGEWVEAKLRKPLSDVTWVIWRYDWPFVEGRHTFAVRAYEGDGTPQIETDAGARPSGATGIHTVTESV
ncbi:MAG: molybdopterin-dependent oxidoreductase [Anaerolineae bacterium]